MIIKAVLLRIVFLSVFFNSVAMAAAKPAPNYTQTRYPIVLVHGMLGFDKMFDVFTYWFGIVEALRQGGAHVFVLSLSPLNSSAMRSEQLLQQVQAIIAITGCGKVNLVGHSQGGIDARYVAAVRPDLVASVTSVSSPHTGAALADDLLSGPQSRGNTALARVVELLGPLVTRLSGHASANDLQASLRSLSTAAATAYNAAYPAGMPRTTCGEGAPEVNGIKLFSWGGIGVHTNALDSLDILWGETAKHYGADNDGLVDRCANHFGQVLRDDYPANHLDTINQMLGLVSPRGANPVEVFRLHANRLRQLGL